MEEKNIFTDEVHIHLLHLPAERERQEWSWQEGGLATRGCDSRQWAKRPGPSPQRLSRGRDCLSGDSTGQTAPWWRSRRERKRRSSLQQKPEVWKRAHRGEVPGGEEGQRREAAAWRHNIQIMVSPQHPCEVGWKVATIVMPTSQTRPGHRGKNTRDGLARQGGPSPLSGLPSIPAEPGPPATQLLVGHGG